MDPRQAGPHQLDEKGRQGPWTPLEPPPGAPPAPYGTGEHRLPGGEPPAGGPPGPGGISHPRSHRPPDVPYVVYGLITVLGLVWLLTELAGGSENLGVLIRWGAQYNPRVWQGETWRLFTAMFLHIGLMHLTLNGLSLYVLGSDVERVFGHGRFLLIYLAAGLGGNLTYLLLEPAGNVSAGASGAIFGLFGALIYFGLHIQARHRQRFWSTVVVVLGVNLWFGFANADFINNYAHLGGLAVGLAVAFLVGLPGESWRSWRRVVGVLLLALLVGVGSLRLEEAQAANWPLHFSRGIEFYDREDWTRAETEFERVIELEPGVAEAHYNLALVYYRQNRLEEARQEFLRALEIDPALNRDVQNMLDAIRARQGGD